MKVASWGRRREVDQILDEAERREPAVP